MSRQVVGLLLRRAQRERVKTFEYQHAAAHLGAPVTYEGRPIAAAHAPHRIMGGQFLRRLTILREVLDAHGVPDDVRAGWLAYHESLRGEVTADIGSECR